jgi:hypothetical protein
MRAMSVERMGIQASFISTRVLNHNLKYFSDFSGERTGDGIDTVIGEGARDGGEFEAIIFVERDEVGFMDEAVGPVVSVLEPDSLPGDVLVDCEGDAAGYLGGAWVVWG